MPLYGALSIATLGMKGQSYAMNVIGRNIANMTTGGFKRSDVNFKTIVSRSYFQQKDNNGARPVTYQRVREQGGLQGTQRALDIAVNGPGLFMVSRQLNGEDVRYTRDGSFEIEARGTNGWLSDKNGYYLLGYPTAGGDLDSTDGRPMPMRVDSRAFLDNFQPTTRAEMGLNLPADAPALGPTDTMTAAQRHAAAVKDYDTDGTRADGLEVYNFQIVDLRGDKQDMRANFTKTSNNNWLVSFTATGALRTEQFAFNHAGGAAEAGEVYRITVNGSVVSYTAAGGETMEEVHAALIADINGRANFPVRAAAADGGGLILTGAAAGRAFDAQMTVTDPDNEVTVSQTDTSSATTDPVPMPFSPTGQLLLEDPLNLQMRFTGADGETVNTQFDLEFIGTNQFEGEFTKIRFESDGLARAQMTGVLFDNDGYVLGRFTDGTQRKIYRLPLATFINPDGLTPRNGNAYQESLESGGAEIRFYNGRMLASAVERSNVRISEEFTKMIITQNAYNSNATVFRTADEMTQTARDLKR